MMNEPVSSIMTTNPVALHPDHTLADVQGIFTKNRIHHLPVVDEGKLVGLITTYDLWKQDLPFDQYSQKTVGEIMTTRLAKIRPHDKVGTAAELFLDNRFHALPVVEDGRLVGIVTSFDVLRYEFIKEYQQPILYKDIYESGIKAVI